MANCVNPGQNKALTTGRPVTPCTRCMLIHRMSCGACNLMQFQPRRSFSLPYPSLVSHTAASRRGQDWLGLGVILPRLVVGKKTWLRMELLLHQESKRFPPRHGQENAPAPNGELSRRSIKQTRQKTAGLFYGGGGWANLKSNVL